MKKEKTALMYTEKGTVVKMTAREAFTAVNKPEIDSGVKNRFVNLFTNVRTNKETQFAIAVSMKEIELNKDYKLFGYKSTAEMCESMFEYKKATTSKMIAVAKYFLTDKGDGKAVPVFGDVSLFNLAELLQDKTVMENMSDSIIKFYSMFPVDEMKQDKLRELKQGVKNVITRGLPLTRDNYDRFLEMKKDEQKETETKEERQASTDNVETEQTEKKVNVIDEIQSHLSAISELFDKLEIKERKSAIDVITAMVEMLKEE